MQGHFAFLYLYSWHCLWKITADLHNALLLQRELNSTFCIVATKICSAFNVHYAVSWSPPSCSVHWILKDHSTYQRKFTVISYLSEVLSRMFLNCSESSTLCHKPVLIIALPCGSVLSSLKESTLENILKVKKST